MNPDSHDVSPGPADRDSFLDPFLIEPGDWCRRLDWRAIFGVPEPPVEIDVGAGKGRLLIESARKDPAAGFVGIERQLVRVRKIARKALRAGLRNVRLIRAEARYVLEYLVPPSTVRTVCILFPDPWPKKRHHKRRLLREGIDEILFRCLRPGGKIHLATDHLEYFEEISALFDASPFFERQDPDDPANRRPITEFETIFVDQNLPIGRAVYTTRPLP